MEKTVGERGFELDAATNKSAETNRDPIINRVALHSPVASCSSCDGDDDYDGACCRAGCVCKDGTN